MASTLKKVLNWERTNQKLIRGQQGQKHSSQAWGWAIICTVSLPHCLRCKVVSQEAATAEEWGMVWDSVMVQKEDSLSPSQVPLQLAAYHLNPSPTVTLRSESEKGRPLPCLPQSPSWMERQRGHWKDSHKGRWHSKSGALAVLESICKFMYRLGTCKVSRKRNWGTGAGRGQPRGLLTGKLVVSQCARPITPTCVEMSGIKVSRDTCSPPYCMPGIGLTLTKASLTQDFVWLWGDHIQSAGVSLPPIQEDHARSREWASSMQSMHSAC